MNLNSSLQRTPVAVVGMSAIFADARNLEEFWTNIIQGKDSITDVPADRWSIEEHYDPDPLTPDKTYCKRGGFLPPIDFNPMEFGLPPNILEVTDASQLLGLVAARDALADAGYGANDSRFTKELKEKTGVLLGVGGGQKLITPLIARLQYPIWERALRSSGITEADIPHIVEKMKKAYVGWNENAFPGLLGNVISGRITNRFDLGGINSVVDAACAASLSAIKMSLSELVEGRADMMLTGGVDTDNSPFMYMSFSKTPAFSKSGNIRPFSDNADGMLIGEGVGMLVLKRLDDAERDGDQIYAVIKGVGTSSDGRFKSVYAPRPAGQALAMQRAYEDAGYEPATVGLLEAHGTGTEAGDPTEFTSMQMVFGANNPQKHHIALGSVKSQIGHTKAAAGAAGMVKAVLALHHRVLPVTINVDKPNSKFNIEDSAIYVNTETRPWLNNGKPRRAGVSAFGFGGINVHIAMEEYLGKKATEHRLHQPFKSILLTASDPGKLLQVLKSTLEEMDREERDEAYLDLAEKSKNVILDAAHSRIGFVARSTEDCQNILRIAIAQMGSGQEEWSHPKGIHFRSKGLDTSNQKVVALFSGQGSQYVGMGKEAINAYPLMADSFEQVDALFRANDESPLSGKVFPIPVFTQEEKTAQLKILTQTQYAQPAIGTLSMGQYRAMQQANFKPAFCAGHSFGEITALWAAGAYDDNTFLALAKARGDAMAVVDESKDAGTMLAVKASAEQVEHIIGDIPKVIIANVNSGDQVVLGGSTSAVRKAEEQLKVAGFSVIQLPVSGAFHTEHMAHAHKPFSRFIGKQTIIQPAIPVFSNTTGKVYPENMNSFKALLKKQMVKPVLFNQQIENLYKAGGRIFVEFGPRAVLTNLVRSILKDKEHFAIAMDPNATENSDMQMRQAFVQLQVLGLPLSDLDPYKKDLVPLPIRSKLTVQISGNNYVSSETQKAYQDVLDNGFQVSGSRTSESERTNEQAHMAAVPAGTDNAEQTESEEDMLNSEALRLLQATLESFKEDQSRSLDAFEKFMKQKDENSKQLLEIIANQLSGNAAPVVMASKPAPIAAAASTPAAHTIVQASDISNGSAHHEAPAQTPVPPASEATTAPGMELSKLTTLFLSVVSEKTGYPAEMLELSMDLEADLGIDSIKRVEIFGALTQQYPGVSGIDPNDLAELRTLGSIVDHVAAKSGANGAAHSNSPLQAMPTAVVAPNTTPDPIPAPSTATSVGDMDTKELSAKLLAVVSEKTGYPAEMLELGMDLEADLGIDSIKRVEIFGALTLQNPGMAGIDPTQLAELRTLGEIVNFVSGKSASPASVAAPSQPAAPVTAITTPSSNGNGMDIASLQTILLQVVSEKTGYPAEMLEMTMDLEADLGIDSIKRVEIFGALTQKYPEAAGVDPTALAELRTLGEIVAFVSNKKKSRVPA